MKKNLYKILSVALIVSMTYFLIPAPKTYATYGYLVSGAGQGSSCTGTDASVTLDTTGADLIVILTVTNDAQTAPTDSKSNTWSIAKSQTAFPGGIYYSQPPSNKVGSSHTFTVSNANRCAGISVAAYSGSAAASVLDQTSTSASSCGGSTCQAGSVTPSENNEIVITTLTVDPHNTISVSDSAGTFNIRGCLEFTSGTAYAVCLADLIETTATATNPTWSFSNPALAVATIATFKAGAAAAATTLPAVKMIIDKSAVILDKGRIVI